MSSWLVDSRIKVLPGGCSIRCDNLLSQNFIVYNLFSLLKVHIVSVLTSTHLTLNAHWYFRSCQPTPSLPSSPSEAGGGTLAGVSSGAYITYTSLISPMCASAVHIFTFYQQRMHQPRYVGSLLSLLKPLAQPCVSPSPLQ